MSPHDDEQPTAPDDQPQSNQPGSEKNEDDGLIRGQVRHSQLSARVPEEIASGVFSTGAIVLMGGTEFIIDFVLRMQRPHQIVARVVMPHAIFPQMINAMEQNITRFEDRFGKIPELPKPPKPEPGAPRPSIEDVYDELKLPDDRLGGDYANSVMVSHSACEFCFDFIANFFPRSAVTRRVFVAAPQVPRMLDAFRNTYQEFQKRLIANRRQQLAQLQPKNPTLTLRPEDLQNAVPGIPGGPGGPGDGATLDGRNPYYNEPKSDGPEGVARSADDAETPPPTAEEGKGSAGDSGSGSEETPPKSFDDQPPLQ